MSNLERLIAPQLIYKQVPQIAPRYKYVRINMSNINSNQVALTANNSVVVQFKLPFNTVFNLSKSRFSHSLTVPAQAAAVSAMIADAYPYVGEVSLETANGLKLLSLTESSRFSKIVGKTSMSLDEFLARDVSDLCYKSNVANANGANATPGALRDQTENYIETKYENASVAGVANTVEVSYELGNFKETILGIDKDLYFGQNEMNLTFNISGYDKWVYDRTATATLNPVLATLDSVYLYLAVEQNPFLIDEIRKKFDGEGLKLLISYPIITRTQTQASTNQSIVIPFVPGNGKTLKRIYHTIWHVNDTMNRTMDCDNTNGTRIVSYNTYVDSTKLQDDLVSCATLDPWRLNGPWCKNTPILTRDVYMKNFFHCDSFEDPEMAKDKSQPVPPENRVDGLEMTKGFQYQFVATTGNSAFLHINFAIFQRLVGIDKNGVQFL